MRTPAGGISLAEASATVRRMTHVTLTVHGMTCQNCVRHVNKALDKSGHVQNVAIDLPSGRVELDFDETQTTW